MCSVTNARPQTANAKASQSFLRQHLQESGIEVEKIGSQMVEYKTEDNAEVQGFRLAHKIFMDGHYLQDIAAICQINADESHLFWFD